MCTDLIETVPPMPEKSHPGEARMTLAAQAAMEASGQTWDYFLERHVVGDWGLLTKPERIENERALKNGDLTDQHRNPPPLASGVWETHTQVARLCRVMEPGGGVSWRVLCRPALWYDSLHSDCYLAPSRNLVRSEGMPEAFTEGQRVMTKRSARSQSSCPEDDLLGFGRRLARQWAIYRELSAMPEGATIKELVAATGVADKTVRRAFVIFRRVGIDLVERVQAYGRKVYRIARPFEAATDRRQRYRLIRDSVRELIAQAETLGDAKLAADLRGVERRLAGKGKGKEPKSK